MKKRYLAAGSAMGAVGGLIAWKMITRPREIRWEQVADKVHHPAHSNFVEVDGTTIHYQEFGEKSAPIMLLIHGYTASTHTWQTAAPALARKGFRVIAADLVGFGFSDKPAWFDYSIVSQARILSRFMNRLGIGRCTLVGSSYGGAVASTIALDYPEFVEKLVLIGAVCNDDVKHRLDARFVTTTGLGEVVSPFLVDSKAFVKHRLIESLAPENHHLITKETIDAIHRPLAAADGHNSVLKTLRNWHAERIEHDANLISQPTLLIWGEKDAVIPVKNGYRLHQLILNSRLVIMPNCGHIPHVERSEAFVGLVSEFSHNQKGKLANGNGSDMAFAGETSEKLLDE